MSLKVRLTGAKNLYFLIIACVSFILISLFILNNLEAFGDQQEKVPSNNAANLQNQIKSTRKATSTETSPDGSKKITRYELTYNPDLFGGNYSTYLNGNIIISITNIFPDIEREYYIFIGEERTGTPHWLGNNYVFFTTYCGSSCQGLALLDVRTSQKRLGTLSFLSSETALSRTHFHDWFDKNFEFRDSIKNIRGALENNQPFLIFDMENEKGVETGEKRFLFTGDSLIPKN